MTAIVKEQGQKGLADGDISEERASRFFLVISDAAISEVTAAKATGVPTYFDAHPDDPTYLMKQKRARSMGEEAGRFIWEVQCDYSNQIIMPLNMPPQIEWDFSEASEDYFFDTKTDTDHPNGYPVCASTGQPFDSVPQRESGSITCNVTVNVPTTFDTSLCMSFREMVNSSSTTIDGVTLSAHQGKVSGISVSPPQKSNGQWYRTAKLVIKCKLTWDDIFADVAYCQLDSNGKLTPIVAGTPPQAVQKPWPLDGSGHAKTNPTDMPAKITRYPYHEADFAGLDPILAGGGS